jgi:hypothetical protein
MFPPGMLGWLSVLDGEITVVMPLFPDVTRSLPACDRE